MALIRFEKSQQKQVSTFRIKLTCKFIYLGFFKLFDHCFDFLTQIRRHAVHLIMGAEKETEGYSAVANTDLVTDRPAKLRVRAPSKTNYALRLLTKAIAGCNVYKKVE